MTVTVPLSPEIEASVRADADREGIAIEAVLLRHLEEARLIRRIISYVRPDETRRVRALIGKRRAGTIRDAEREELAQLIHLQEQKAADRLQDIAALARLRGVSYQAVMAELGIRPARIL